MTTPPKLLIITLICTLPLAGCGGEGSIGFGTSTTLSGTWKSSCIYDSEKARYSQTTLSMSGTTLTAESTYGDYGDCTKPSFKTSIQGEYKIKEDVILSSGITATNLIVDINKVYVTLLNDRLIAKNNDLETCDHSNWQGNVKVEISNCPTYSPPGTVYDIFKIEGDDLFLGDGEYGDFRSKNTSPTQLGSESYVRQ
jgi:hypothetical protein